MKPYDHLVESAETLDNDALDGFIEALRGVLAARLPTATAAYPTLRKYSVSLDAYAVMKTTITVEAKTATKAEELAVQLAESGDVVWEYSCLCDNPQIQSYDIQEIK